jgi:hypothetical protein
MTPQAGRTTARRHQGSTWLAAGLAAGLAGIGLTLATAGTSRADTTGAPPAPAAVPMVSIKLTGAQASGNEGYLVGRLRPGTTERWQMQIANTGKTTATVSVYPAAASVTGGSFQFAPGKARDQLTTWASVSQPALTLKPHQSVTEVATIAVPRDARSGEQYGVIWAQTSTAKQTSRTGIRMYLSVGSGKAPATAFSMGAPATTRQAGQPVLSVPVRNTGGLAVNLAGSLSLSGGPGGQHAGPFKAPPIVTLAPGQDGNVIFTLTSSLPAGSWKAQVTLRGGSAVRNGNFTVSLSSLTGAKAAASAGSSDWLLVGGLTAAAVLVALVAGGALFRVRSRRRAAAS